MPLRTQLKVSKCLWDNSWEVVFVYAEEVSVSKVRTLCESAESSRIVVRNSGSEIYIHPIRSA